MRRWRLLIATMLACAVGVLPSCASMGGGMKYAAPDTSLSVEQLVSM